MTSAAPKKISFNRDVRAILSENCYTCHGPDAAARKAKLRLDKREAAVAENMDGLFAIKPGDVEDSELIYRIFAKDAGSAASGAADIPADGSLAAAHGAPAAEHL